jgi:hypothetical protein
MLQNPAMMNPTIYQFGIDVSKKSTTRLRAM